VIDGVSCLLQDDTLPQRGLGKVGRERIADGFGQPPEQEVLGNGQHGSSSPAGQILAQRWEAGENASRKLMIYRRFPVIVDHPAYEAKLCNALSSQVFDTPIPEQKRRGFC
jgi:hypothetical protein